MCAVLLKVGEVWEEVNRELGLDGVRPITPDEEALSTICKISEDTARRVVEEQNGIVEQQEKEEMSEEELMYTEVLGVFQTYLKTSKFHVHVRELQSFEHSLCFPVTFTASRFGPVSVSRSCVAD